jgi:hypothetical protein
MFVAVKGAILSFFPHDMTTVNLQAAGVRHGLEVGKVATF